METRANLLKLLEKVEILSKKYLEYQQNYGGPGLLKKFKRLLRLLKYREKYLKYCFSKFKFYQNKLIILGIENHLSILPKDFYPYYYSIIYNPEIRLSKYLIKNLRDNSIFYDIGANIGYYCFLAKEISDFTEIHAFEPAPKNMQVLRKNLLNKQNIFLNQLALFNKEDKIDFYDTIEIGSGGSTFSSSRAKFLPNFKKIKVQTTTLDKYCANHSSWPDLIKIDVEGAEGQVIEGGIKILKEGSPIIAMEVWKNVLGNTSHLKAIEILYNLGYKSYKINKEGDLEFIEKIDPEKDILEKDEADNFIFKKE